MELNNTFTTTECTYPSISRPLRRKKKSCNNFEEPKNLDSTMDKNPFLQNTFTKWERVLGKIPHRSSYLSAEQFKRLTGGADKDMNNANRNSLAETDTPASNNPTAPVNIPQRRESHVPSHRHSIAVSERKVDEIIDCAIQNLQEAGKALASLGENHERELKLMVMDVLTKFQKSIDAVQKKLDSAKIDINSIQRVLAAQTIELTAKDRELTNLRNQLMESEAAKTALEKKITENQPIVERAQSHASIASNLPVTIPPVNPPTVESTSQHLPFERIINLAVPVNQVVVPNRNVTPQTTISSLAPLPDLNPPQNVENVVAGNMTINLSVPTAPVARKASQSQVRVPGSIEQLQPILPIETQSSQLLSSIPVPEHNDPSQPTPKPSRLSSNPFQQNLMLNQYPPPNPNVSPAVINSGTITNNLVLPVAVSRATSAAPLVSAEQVRPTTISQATSAAPLASVEQVEPITISRATSAAPLASEQVKPTTISQAINATQLNKNNKEQEKRVVELEAALIQLRDENEKMKIDHESAVQKALLQDVSSINAEVLKVSRNPSFICYKPCEPCNPPRSASPSDTTSNVPCVIQIQKDRAPQRNGKYSSRKQAISVCYAPVKKSSPNSMMFLLPQQHIDCVCTDTKQNYCVDTNYERIARIHPRDRIHCTLRSTTGRDGFRGMLINRRREKSSKYSCKNQYKIYRADCNAGTTWQS